MVLKNVLENRVITKRDIYSRVNSLEIFKNYCENFKVGVDFNSPFRQDSTPSFAIIEGKTEYIFKDLGTGESGDCFDFVSQLYNLSYFETLSKIATDFNFPKSHGYFFKDMSHIKTSVKEMTDEELQALLSVNKKSVLKVKVREWCKEDALYWKSQGVTYKTLQYYNVKPIEYIFVGDHITKADTHAYVFIEMKDDVETYKIYQPFNKKGLKWLSSHDSSVWQGWTQLPKKGTDLIITKSMKDVMSIVSVLKVPAVAMQSENTKPKYQVIEELKERFENIYVFYDNDFDKDVNLGRMLATNLMQQIGGCYNIEIPDEYQSKDFSDTILKHGVDKTLEIIRNQIIPF